MARPLEGIRVLELTVAVAGPVAGHTLADLGAEVLKIEPPFGRSRKPSEYLVTEPDDRPWDKVPKFNELNRGKQSVVLDLAKPAGRDAFLALVRQSDVVLINFSARVLDQLGLRYEDLRAVKDDVILVALTGFGTSGPYQQRISYGPGVDAMSGLAFMTGYLGGSPMKAGNHYFDQHTGMLTALATIAALRHRQQTGAGQFVDVSMFQAGSLTTGEVMLSSQLGIAVPPRQGSTDVNAVPHNLYACRGDQEWVAIAVQTDEQWAALCAVLGRPELAAAPAYSTLAARRGRRDEIDAIVAGWCAPQDSAAVQETLQASGVPAGAVLRAAGMLQDAHLVARQSNPFVPDPDMGPQPVPAVAWHYDRMQERPVAPAPRFGEHTAEVLTSRLGLTAADIERLRQDGVITTEPVRGGH
ncbi:MAG: CoA transferase [Chloroflexi bacterium]|nr:CoA transferase [Chloroflexota bacterium]